MTVTVKCSCGTETSINTASIEIGDRITSKSIILADCHCKRKIVIVAYDYDQYALVPKKKEGRL